MVCGGVSLANVPCGCKVAAGDEHKFRDWKEGRKEGRKTTSRTNEWDKVKTKRMKVR